MDWKIGLDRYLTQSSDDGDYDEWCEMVIESLSDDFYDKNEDWVINDNQCDVWLNKLQDKDPKEAARIIERAYNYYYCVTP